MSNLVNLVKALLSLMFNVLKFEAKNSVFEFDFQQMNTLDFVSYLKDDVRACLMLDKMVFLDSSCISLLQTSVLISYMLPISKIVVERLN